MNSLTKIAVLCAGLALAGCHINNNEIEGHYDTGKEKELTSDGKPCITQRELNISGALITGPAHDILLEELGFDPGVEKITAYSASYGEQPTVNIMITDGSNCLLFLGDLSKTELARTLGIKTFPRGIDREGDK